jgi:hypothetical protein
MEIAAYYDIETENWDCFVCGGLLYANGDYLEYLFDSEREYVESILAIDGTVIAHNGGRFDHLWFLDALDRFGYLDKLSVKLIMSGSSIVRAQIRGPGVNLDLADSYRIFPMSLRKLSNGAKDDTGLRCLGRGDCADIIAYKERYRTESEESNAVYGCGGYCAINRHMPKDDLRRLMDYMRQDCIALKDGIEHMLTVAHGLEINVGYTVGGTAWKTAKDLTEVDSQPLDWQSYYYARNGYFGGRVGLFRRNAESGYQYDITSSYPFQYSQPLPTGTYRNVWSDSKARKAYRNGKPGIYTATVHVPDMFIPPLPVRAEINGESRLAFPIGRFKGTWARPDLDYAESIGCKIEPHSGLVFDEMDSILEPYSRILVGARLKFGKKTREGEWLKLLVNSLYGKLASKPEVQGLYINPNPSVVLGAKDVERIGRELGVYRVTNEKVPDCGHIVWAAYITSRARVQLHKMLTEKDDAIYCDTDSCFSIGDRNSNAIGKNLGDWSYEGPFNNFEGIAPKVYRYLREGKPYLKAKGVVLPGDIDKAWECITRGQRVYGRERIRGFKSALNLRAKGKGRLFEKEKVSRLVKEGFGDRREIHGTNLSRPPRYSELTIS